MTSLSKHSKLNQEAFTSILEYLQQADATDTTTASLTTDTQKLNVNDEQPTTLDEKVDTYCKEFLYIGGPAPKISLQESAPGSITDKIAKDSSDSTASTHQMHDNSGGHMTAAAHNSKGPVMADKLPEAASKEELKKRAEELNK
ncbi:uncharacterized protein yc1106_08490 [Curvularia clavata]|uniref:Uncharacterized protein n=1 Tax=Curvularia clavata TaxID=95742 RepID=A0A9Q9DX69_CURCL|nr:uncharacterized protein yc1106_08490 [Curvularia clavata]